MTEFIDQQTVQPASRWSKCRTIILPAVLVFGYFCLLGAIVLLILTFCFSTPCPSNDDDPKSAQCKRSLKPNTGLGGIFGGVAVILIIIGGIIIIVGHKNMKRVKSVEVVVSEIPAQDLEKTPAVFSLNYGQARIPRHEPASFVADSHSIDLPDYFTVVQQNSEDVYPSVDVAFWTEDRDVSDDENPPPCYEQALKISGLLTTTNDVEVQLEQGRCEDTRL
ncbi:hypothetical protein ABFA07_011635 [Porites harrisoni]